MIKTMNIMEMFLCLTEGTATTPIQQAVKGISASYRKGGIDTVLSELRKKYKSASEDDKRAVVSAINGLVSNDQLQKYAFGGDLLDKKAKSLLHDFTVSVG